MNKSTRLLTTVAAVAGLYAGSLASGAFAADQKAGTPAREDAKKSKHDCAGKNDCKGLGGCKTANNDCKVKNDCKGKGGCSTMDTKDQKKEEKKKKKSG
jgi:hypothetical protein